MKDGEREEKKKRKIGILYMSVINESLYLYSGNKICIFYLFD